MMSKLSYIYQFLKFTHDLIVTKRLNSFRYLFVNNVTSKCFVVYSVVIIKYLFDTQERVEIW